MAKLKIGIIGAGMIAQDHIRNLNQLKGVKVTWVADINEKLLRKVLKSYRISNGTTDYTNILNDPEVSAVFICTPPSTHFEIFLSAVRAGKHILLEKPASISTGDMKGMIALAENHPELIICEASCRHARLQPKFGIIKKIIDSGKLGSIYYIHHNAATRQARPGIEYNPEAKWFLDKKISGGGPVLDWGVYDLSFHLGILSDLPELESVKSMTMSGLDEKDPGADIFDVEEHAAALMKFKGGLTYFWERATHANVEVPSETRIYGTRGGLKFSFLTWDSPDIEYYYLTKGGKGKAKSKTIKMDMTRHGGDNFELAKHFVAVLLKGKKPAMSIALAAKHLKIISEVYRAAGVPSTPPRVLGGHGGTE